MGKIYQPKEEHTPSDSERFADSVLFMIIVAGILAILTRLIELIMQPFTNPLTKDTARERIQNAFNAKVDRRDKRRGIYHSQLSDPMVQFQRRFLTHVEEYKKDRYNATYLEWYKDWTNGLVRDTQLRWAPWFESLTPSTEFLCYLTAQLNLHRGFARWGLLGTLRAVYPEFTPTSKGVQEDIAAYILENEQEDLKQELTAEVEALGLDAEAAAWLCTRSAAQIRVEAMFLKKCVEQGHSTATAIALLKNKKVEPGSLEAKVVEGLLNVGLPEEVASSYLKGKLTFEEVKEMVESVTNLKDVFGLDFYSKYPDGTDVDQALVAEVVRKVKTKKREAKLEAVLQRNAR